METTTPTSPAKIPAHTPARSALLAICGAFALLSGCTSAPDSNVVSAPPPPPPNSPVMAAPPGTTQTTQTTQTTANGTVVTTQTVPVTTMTVPPALQAEVILARPSSSHVWVPGYWTWRNNRYEWMAGHWEVPPSSGARWTAPRWESEGGAYRFYEGFWK